LVGPFAFQPNNITREYEYPWAFLALDLRPELRVLEIGGSNSGLQFVLARNGCKVVNVDPGERARGRGWPVTQEFHARLNRRFGTDVELRSCFIEDADLPAESFDRALSISTLEHIPENEIPNIAAQVCRSLKPGGLFVLSVDLFLALAPFSRRSFNEWGTNISMRALIEASGLELIYGLREELCGHAEFDPRAILELAKREELVVGTSESAVQTLVLQKPRAAPRDGSVVAH
jgi:SAM-dependent methyltransferase